MANEEKMLLDAVVNMSKSLNRIADELKIIRESVTLDQRNRLRESRRAKYQKGGQLLTESKNGGKSRGPAYTGDAAKQAVQDIFAGKYLPDEGKRD